MKRLQLIIFLLSAFGALFFVACTSTRNSSVSQVVYKPDNQQLYDTIVHLDSLFFAAYNNCDMRLDEYSAFYDSDVEFYHDKGGLMTTKQEIVDATKKNVCGKVSRELMKGSIEVYPIGNYGAVEMGLHKFHNNTEKETTPSHAGKFVIIWQNKNGAWKIKRVISLH